MPKPPIRNRKNTVKPQKNINISPNIINWTIFSLSALYIFCYFLAKTSPIFQRFSNIGAFLYGNKGCLVLSIIGIVISITMIYRRSQDMRILWKLFILSIFVSIIINFPIIDHISTDYLLYGGYISRLPIYILQSLFGDNILAIKIISIIPIIAISIWIWYTIDISIPQFSINISKDNPDIIKQNTTNNHKNNNKNMQDNLTDISIYETKQTTQTAIINKNADNINNTDTNLKTILKNKLLGKLGIDTNASTDQHISHIYNNKQIHTPTQNFSKNTKKISYPQDKPTFETQKLSHGDRDIYIDDIWIASKGDAIVAKLAEFGVPVIVVGRDIGPSVIQIKVQPQAGVKLSKIEGHKNDLLLALKAKSLRIIAPIPGTDTVGIEILNPKPNTVHLADILESNNFGDMMNHTLTNISVGKQINGDMMIKSLEKMPHLLVAGATGMGKSVAVNDFIISLIFQNTPEELKFIMVDPKQVEMEFYNGLPYLLCPIITEAEKALKALKRATTQMDSRYELLSKVRVKQLSEYNEVAQEKLPRIIIVIDELADLMLNSKLKKDVETAITRIAQKARAVGIHLLLATQRPSVNVITGLIKANIPARISLGVVSQIDSRTILDIKGAEDLAGKGDLLYKDADIRHPVRVQAPFISNADIEIIISQIKNKYMRGLSEEDIYDADLVAIINSESGRDPSMGGVDIEDGDEDLVMQAVDMITGLRTASVTKLQRDLKIGFARAGRIMDILESKGIVGPQEAPGKPREVLI